MVLGVWFASFDSSDCPFLKQEEEEQGEEGGDGAAGDQKKEKKSLDSDESEDEEDDYQVLSLMGTWVLDSLFSKCSSVVSQSPWYVQSPYT